MYAVIALLLLAASPEVSADTPAADTTQAKPTKPKKICRSGGATGSRLPSKICKTQAEWDALMESDTATLDGKRGSATGY